MKSTILKGCTLTVLFFTLLLGFNPANAQTEASISAMSESGLLTYFIGQDLNQVTPKVEQFLQDNLRKTTLGLPKFAKEAKISLLVQKFVNQADNINAPNMVFKYYLKDNSNIITHCEILGTRTDLANFFVSYWNTQFDFNTVSGNHLVKRQFLNDHVVYSLIPNSNNAKIVIE
jgi:hypothetical protein